MSPAAESFAGRVLAVFSRRSPAFRPPPVPSGPSVRPGRAGASPPAPVPGTPGRHETARADPDRDDGTEPGLAGVTARWKHLPAPTRLQRREALIELANGMKAAQKVAQNLTVQNRELNRLHSRGLVRVLDNLREQALDVDDDLARALEGVRDRLRLVHPDPLTTFWGRLELGHILVRDLGEARSNLIDAANEFVRADLTTVDLAQADLAWVRWDHHTRWPTREWADRILRASVEHPPGSGVFIVLPEEDHDFAELTVTLQ